MASKTCDLEDIRGKFYRAQAGAGHRVIVCAGTGCVANGSLKVYAKLAEEIEKKGLPVILSLRFEDEHKKDAVFVSKSGCQGFCQMGPLVTILPENIFYTDDRADLVESASALGIKSFVFTGPGKLIKDLSSLDILLDEQRQP